MVSEIIFFLAGVVVGGTIMIAVVVLKAMRASEAEARAERAEVLRKTIEKPR